MLKANRKYGAILMAGLIWLAFLAFLAPASVNSQGVDKAIEGVDKAIGGLDQVNQVVGLPTEGVESGIGRILGIALSLVGALFLGLMIYGGLLWMTARGNEAEVKKAKDLIVAAVIGLIIVFSAYAITAFVGSMVSGT